MNFTFQYYSTNQLLIETKEIDRMINEIYKLKQLLKKCEMPVRKYLSEDYLDVFEYEKVLEEIKKL